MNNNSVMCLLMLVVIILLIVDICKKKKDEGMEGFSDHDDEDKDIDFFLLFFIILSILASCSWSCTADKIKKESSIAIKCIIGSIGLAAFVFLIGFLISLESGNNVGDNAQIASIVMGVFTIIFILVGCVIYYKETEYSGATI